MKGKILIEFNKPPCQLILSGKEATALRAITGKLYSDNIKVILKKDAHLADGVKNLFLDLYIFLTNKGY